MTSTLIVVNACCYCGNKAEGHYAIPRDGSFSGGPQLPLCDAHGEGPRPSLQEIWARVAIVDDDGTEWGPTQGPCREPLPAWAPDERRAVERAR